MLLSSLAAVDAQPSTSVAESGFSSGSAVLIRIFKEGSQLELWMQKDERFELLATYPICFWSGDPWPQAL